MSDVLLPLVRKLWIVDKQIGLHPLEPNWAQLRYLQTAEDQLKDSGRIRIIVLKARQLGISTISEALAFTLCFLYEQYRALVVAHEVKSSQRILDMTKLYWEMYPFRSLYSLKYNSRNDMAWRESGSSIKVATAGRKNESGVGRGDTIHFMHASEVAFWDAPENVMLSVMQSIPPSRGTGVVLESTANGVGNYFERTWKEATAGENEFAPLFFSWLDHPEYTAEFYSLDATKPLTNPDEEERALQAIGATKSQLIWRRWAISNLCQSDELKFAQEYPATPEQAFIATGTNVFSYPLLRAAFDKQQGVAGNLIRNGNKVTFEPHPGGKLTVFKAPSYDEWGSYMVAGDPTHTTRGDYACAQVINRHTLEQVAVYRARVDPGSFGEELFKLGLYFNKALVSSEAEGPASLTIGKLLGMNYPRIYRRARPDRTPGKQQGDIWGWMTTNQSKAFMVGVVKKYLVDQSLVLHDAQTFEEMRDYIIDENGAMGPADSERGHDDTVMALAQALACHYLEGPIMPYGTDRTPDTSNPWGDGPPPWENWEGAA